MRKCGKERGEREQRENMVHRIAFEHRCKGAGEIAEHHEYHDNETGLLGILCLGAAGADDAAEALWIPIKGVNPAEFGLTSIRNAVIRFIKGGCFE